MTISLAQNAARVSYSVSEGATQTSFTVSFEFFDDADLNVYVDGTLKSISTHYTVSGGSGSTGAVAISVTGATGGSTVVITRDIALARTTDFPTSGSFQIATLNTELDRFTAIAADLKDSVDRGLILSDSDSSVSTTLPLLANRKGTVLGFNASTGAVEAGPSITAVQSLADVTASINLLGTSDAVSDMNTLATTSNVNNISSVAGIASNVSTVAGIASDVTAVAGDATDIGAVAAKATEIGRLGTSAAVADMAILGTSDVVADMNTLGTAAIVEDMNLLGTSANVTAMGLLGNSTVIADMAILGTSDIVADMAILGTSDVVSDMNTLATSDIISDMNTLATSANVTAMSTVATNIASVNNFDARYRVSSSAPSSSLDVGDLWWNTSDNTINVYASGSWNSAILNSANFQPLGGTTNYDIYGFYKFASTSGVTFRDSAIQIFSSADGQLDIDADGEIEITTALVDLNGALDVSGNITVGGTVDGRDLATDGSKLDGIEASATADQTASEIRTLVESASDSNVFTDADHTKLNGVAASANNYVHPNHSGEVTSTADGATVIADDVVDEANLKVSNSPTNGYALTAQSGNTGGLTWAAMSGGASASDDLYIANPSSATDPTAAGSNAVSIGSGSVASGEKGFALLGGTASGQYAMAFNNYAVASAEKSISLGWLTDATATSAVAIGTGTQSSASHSVALGQSNARGADSFAAAIGSVSSSYGASGANSVALGSGLARATGARSIAIANNAAASGADSVAIGRSAESSASAAFTFGYHCIASAANTIASGLQASAAIIGKSAYASGSFAGTNNGDAQGGQYILRSDTTDATAEAMTTNNSTAAATNQIVAASDTCITFSGTVVAMQNGAQAYGSWEIKGLLVNDGGTTTVPNSAITVIHNASSWGLALSADNTNNALTVQVTGEASHNIRWVANVQTSEVTFA